ncbi:hypothetical protein MKW94_002496, partial [Papaver nudicaule]|nr:hypothetical protein [Papaver nudicaule]
MMQGAEEDSMASGEAITLLLFGRVGRGKSAVGNSIIGKKAFASRASASDVTTECQMETATLDDGQVVNVIDTPGIFKSSKGADQRLVDETLRSINTLAKDGIHGFIFVCSIRTRFSAEEDRIVESLKLIFGEKILDHVIIVFTGGDDLEDMTFPEYLSTLPPSFQCGNRVVLFDNRSKEESQRRVQVQQLMSHIVSFQYYNSVKKKKTVQINNKRSHFVQNNFKENSYLLVHKFSFVFKANQAVKLYFA